MGAKLTTDMKRVVVEQRSLGHRDMSRPTSLNRGNAFSSKPGI
jgi:hypothetical protein